MWLAAGIVSLLAWQELAVFCALSALEPAIGDVCLDVKLSGGFGMANFAICRYHSLYHAPRQRLHELPTVLLYYGVLVSLAALAAARGSSVWWEGVSITDFGYGQSKDTRWAGKEGVLDSPTEFKSLDVDFVVKGAKVPV